MSYDDEYPRDEMESDRADAMQEALDGLTDEEMVSYQKARRERASRAVSRHRMRASTRMKASKQRESRQEPWE